jgi:hypothetical protein
MDAWLFGKRIELDPASAIGKGGEADVYDLRDGRALKIFKPETHPDYAGMPEEQAAARLRIEEHQHKLRAFPRTLPRAVIAPEALATDRSGDTVLGYAMRLVDGAQPLLGYSDKAFRAAVPAAAVLALFRGLQDAVQGLHARGVTIGDFNDLNVLVRGGEPFLIDADSFQFGPYPCRVFTERFLDPLIADAGRLVAPYRPESDWYAFAALLMQSLLFVGPYGGIYRPRDPARKLATAERPAARVTIFHPEVQYPRPAAPLLSLPDDLLHAFYEIFVRDARGPMKLDARFQRCASCGLEHARSSCPVCAPHAGASAQTATVIRGKITANILWEGRGLLYACAEKGEPRWVWHDGEWLRREDGSRIQRQFPTGRIRVQGLKTLLGGHDFDCCDGRHVWSSGGTLRRETPLGPERIADVLPGPIWLGPSMGFGTYQAGEMTIHFLFDPARRGLNDEVRLPPRSGRVVSAECVFDADHVWYLEARRESGSAVHRCLQLDKSGRVLAEAEAEEGDGTWLGTLPGKCAADGLLLCPTDSGLVRVEARAGRLVQTREFPDTGPFIDSATTLFLARQGLCAAGRGRIAALQLAN